ncbi:hypothetical protein PR003_g14968 [Phytophthora rubi]|uniref:Uncharacterized protein n=1 Tax=Phytophthora rubi TaxID=129364 RepID=A0A6A4F2F2_9STRA|nr:hypothetical protein PR003_g14968 [Phytophthora rubi]
MEVTSQLVAQSAMPHEEEDEHEYEHEAAAVLVAQRAEGERADERGLARALRNVFAGAVRGFFRSDPASKCSAMHSESSSQLLAYSLSFCGFYGLVS